MRRVIILGTSRTGSKFYMQLLNSHRNINISPELIFRHPFKRDFYHFIKSRIKISNERSFLAREIHSFNERFTFKRTIDEIGYAHLIQGLNKLDKLTPETIFELILDLHAKKRNKSISGAKFPIHVKYSRYLISKLRFSHIIFLTRNPNAIFVSDFLKKQNESKGIYYRFPIKGFFLRKTVLLYSIYEWYRSMKNFEYLSKILGPSQIRLYDYDLVLKEPKVVLDNLSKQLSLESTEFSLSGITREDSSYSKGLSNERWRSIISPLEVFIIRILAGKKMKRYGY